MKTRESGITRRTLVQASGAAGAGLMGLTVSADALSQSRMKAKGKDSVRAIALIGDRFHNADYIRVSLDRVFHDLGIPVDYTIAYDRLSANTLKDYQLLLILRDGQIFPNGYIGPDKWSDYTPNLESPKASGDPGPTMWMTEEQGVAIKEFVTRGNGFYALHNSSHISLSSKDYRDVMGGAFIQHPPLRPFQVRATQNRHPITEGIAPFMVTDEQHFVSFDKDPKYVILEAENIDGLPLVCGEPKPCLSKSNIGGASPSPDSAGTNLGTRSITGWAYDFEKGRVVLRRSATISMPCGHRHIWRFRRDPSVGC